MLKYILIFLGAGVGGVGRYWLGGLVQSWCGPAFPFGTMIVNISGCLVMGFLATAWDGPVAVRDEVRAAILIGVLGGYTTFSSFGRETLALATNGEWARAGAYVLGSVALSLVGVWLGAVIATKLCGVAS